MEHEEGLQAAVILRKALDKTTWVCEDKKFEECKWLKLEYLCNRRTSRGCTHHIWLEVDGSQQRRHKGVSCVCWQSKENARCDLHEFSQLVLLLVGLSSQGDRTK
eukprot:2369106-Amphidinium_carterae.1